MPTCLTRSQIDDYRGRRLSAAEVLAVDAHLAMCGTCREHAAAEGQYVDHASGYRLQAADCRPLGASGQIGLQPVV